MSGRRGEPPVRDAHRHLLVAALSWLAVTAAGEAVVQLLVAGRLPLLASREGGVSDDAIVFLLRLVVPVFAFVTVIVVYAALRFRTAEDDVTDAALQQRDHGRFSWSFLAVSAALTVLLTLYPGVAGINDIFAAKNARDPLVVNVTASQWQWSYSYPAQGVSGAAELVLPVGRTVRFVLRSRDVIHSFWVPAFRIKEDVIPGERRELYLTPDRIVSTSVSSLARVQCAELCGIGHAQMRTSLRVVTPRAFGAWAARMRGAG